MTNPGTSGKICASGRGYGTCGDCEALMSCGKVGMVIGNNGDALNNLRKG